MTGEKLREILLAKGFVLKDIAVRLGTSQQNFIQVMKAQDVKTGLVEKLCKILDLSISDFYQDIITTNMQVTAKEGDILIPRSVLSQMSETIKNQQQTIDRLTAEKRAYHALATDAACAAAK